MIESLKLIIHAPTPSALIRARNNAANLLAARPDARVRIIANGEAVAEALTNPDEAIDAVLVLCENSLARQGLKAKAAGQQVTPAAVVLIAELQVEGWGYMRA